MKKPRIDCRLALTALVGALLLGWPLSMAAQGGNQQGDSYFRGTVTDIEKQETQVVAGAEMETYLYRVELRTGARAGETIEVEQSNLDLTAGHQPIEEGDKVVVVQTARPDGPGYYIADHFRLPAYAWAAALFLVAVGYFGRRRGLSAVVGLTATVLIVYYYLTPRLVSGDSALATTLVAALLIAVVSLFLAHGLNRRTGLAFIGTAASLLLSVALGLVFLAFARLFGFGSDTVIYLQSSGLGNFDPRGLLLSGIILGTLGVLDDVTVAQATVTEELKRANASLGFGELFQRAQKVGREHIASMVNTLFLAYLGVSLPVFLYFVVDSTQPAWFVLNSQIVGEEVIRTLVGSIGLVLAVPITTALAAWRFSRRPPVMANE